MRVFYIFFTSLFLLFFMSGCSDEKEIILDKPPIQGDITNDIPIAQSEPTNEIDPELPPVPVTE